MRFARGLGDRFRFVFVCLDELGTLGERLQSEGFAVHVLGRRQGIDWRCSRRLRSLLRQEQVELVHSHQYTPFFYAAMARWPLRQFPIVFTEHGRHYPDYPRKKRIWANRLLLGRRDRVVGVGRAVREALIVNEGLPAQRVDVIYNGVDLSPFRSPALRDRAAARQELQWNPEEFVIVQVARLDPLKDHLTAVRALARVRESLPNARLVLAGEGPERASIEAEVKKLRLSAHVTMLGQRQDVPRLLAASDLSLLSSRSEGIPLTLIEAMAAGVPVVATNVGGVSEVVEADHTGLLAPAGDEHELAAAVLRVANNTEFTRRMTALAQRRVFDHFSEDRMHAAYARVYEDSLSR